MTTEEEQTKAKKKEVRDNYIKTLLSVERRKPQGLGQGYHRNRFYYGSTVEIKDKTHDCIITSNREIFIDHGKGDVNEITSNFGLNYRFPFYEEVLDFAWTRNGINKWLFEKYKVALKDTFDKLVKLNKEFMLYEDERTHIFIALDILKTYFFQLFPASGRTFFNAEPGSGKTNQIMIYKTFSFNPTTSADFSKASIYRIIESTGATILFDDLDELPEQQKLEVIRHIRVNYKKFKTIRADGGGGLGFKPTAYNSYSHLVFNNVYGLGNDNITPQRLIVVRVLKHPEAKNLTFDSDNVKWSPLRDDLYTAGLQYWKQVYDNYHKINDEDLESRQLEIFKPILAIAKTISDDVHNDVLEWYKENVKRELVIDISENWEYLMLKDIWNRVKNKKDDEIVKITVKDLGYIISANLGYHELSKKEQANKLHSLCIHMGRRLKSYLMFKGYRIDGKTCYDVYRSGIKQVIKSVGYSKDILESDKNKGKNTLSIEPRSGDEDSSSEEWDI